MRIDKRIRIKKVAREISKCKLCPLWKGRKNPVAGEGNADARMFFVGEAPGKAEDRTGRPFVGPAGKILDECMAEAGIRRDDVFITSAVKCRPPLNRTPTKKEILACRKYLVEQIKIIDPEVLIALGKTGAYALLLKDVNVLNSREREFETGLGKVRVTFHPAFILRFGKYRKAFINDLRRIKKGYF